jgi:hypothetical protein
MLGFDVGVGICIEGVSQSVGSESARLLGLGKYFVFVVQSIAVKQALVQSE